MPTQFQAVAPAENRIWDALLFHTEQEVKYRINNPLGSGNDMEAYRLKLEYLQDLQKSYKRNLTKPEKATKIFLRNEIRKLKVKTNPTIWNYLIRGRLARYLLNTVFANQNGIQGHLQQFNKFEKSVGQEQNLANLGTQLKQAGFNQNIDHALQKMLGQGLPKFHIRYADMQQPNTDFVLHFTKIPGSSTYVLEKFDAAARPSWEQTNKLGTSSNWMSFSLLGQEVFRPREAANLLNGRSISKGNDQWIVLDRTNPQNPYKTISFNLEKALSQIPLPEMNAIKMKNFIDALQKGEMKELSFNIDGKMESYRIYANPIDQSIRAVDKNNSLVDPKQIGQINKQQSQKAVNIIKQSQDNVIKGNFRKAIK